MFHESIRYVIEAFVISLWILCGVFGACIGSFLNVVIVRLPKGESIVRPRSRCPSCGAGIAWYDNIPVLSFLLLLGKCRRCKKSISPRYLLVELLAAGLALATLAHERQVSTFLVYYCLFVAPLLTVIFIDLERRIIPNEISLSGIVIGLVIMHAFWDSLLGILVGGGFLFLVGWIYEKLKKKGGVGGRRCQTGGDVRRIFRMASGDFYFAHGLGAGFDRGTCFNRGDEKKLADDPSFWSFFGVGGLSLLFFRSPNPPLVFKPLLDIIKYNYISNLKIY